MAEDQTLTIESVSRTVVAQLNPSEVNSLEVYLAAYSRDPKIVSARRRRGDDPIGFGGALDTIAPYVVGAASAAFAIVTAELLTVIREEAGKQVRPLVQKVLRRRKHEGPVSKVDVEALSPMQMDRVRVAAAAKARQMGMSEDRAEVLADAVLGALAGGA